MFAENKRVLIHTVLFFLFLSPLIFVVFSINSRLSFSLGLATIIINNCYTPLLLLIVVLNICIYLFFLFKKRETLFIVCVCILTSFSLDSTPLVFVYLFSLVLFCRNFKNFVIKNTLTHTHIFLYTHTPFYV